MWMVTPRGFFAACRDRNDPDKIIVRARLKKDMKRLRQLMVSLEMAPLEAPWFDPKADYRYRMVLSRGDWVVLMMRLAEEVDYPTLKARIREVDGKKRYRVMEDVWEALLGLEEM